MMRSSLGAHVRHQLEHVAALINGLTTGEVCYDARPRRVDWQTVPTVAAVACEELANALQMGLAATSDAAPLWVVLAQRQGPAARLGSTVGRELAFVQGHGVHHVALLQFAAPLVCQGLDPSLWTSAATLQIDAAAAATVAEAAAVVGPTASVLDAHLSAERPR